MKTYTLVQIADFLPWVFSAQLLFEPIRTTLYCLKTGHSVEQSFDVIRHVRTELINDVAETAVF